MIIMLPLHYECMDYYICKYKFIKFFSFLTSSVSNTWKMTAVSPYMWITMPNVNEWTHQAKGTKWQDGLKN